MRSKVLVPVLVAALLSGCAHPRKIDGATYPPYGLANEQANRDPSVVYEIPFLNGLVAIAFVETIVIPAYIVGWDLYEPVGKKPQRKAPS